MAACQIAVYIFIQGEVIPLWINLKHINIKTTHQNLILVYRFGTLLLQCRNVKPAGSDPVMAKANG